MSIADPQLARGRRFWATRALTLAGALALGLLLQHGLAARLEALQSLAREEPVRARAELAFLLRVVGSGVFGFTGVLGMAMIEACRRAIEAERFPPPGAWSWSAARIVTGPRARRLALAAMGVAVTLVACSIAGGALTWHMAARLLACRAS